MEKEFNTKQKYDLVVKLNESLINLEKNLDSYFNERENQISSFLKSLNFKKESMSLTPQDLNEIFGYFNFVKTELETIKKHNDQNRKVSTNNKLFLLYSSEELKTEFINILENLSKISDNVDYTINALISIIIDNNEISFYEQKRKHDYDKNSDFYKICEIFKSIIEILNELLNLSKYEIKINITKNDCDDLNFESRKIENVYYFDIESKKFYLNFIEFINQANPSDVFIYFLNVNEKKFFDRHYKKMFNENINIHYVD